MDVLFEGALTVGRGMPDLLRALQAVPTMPFAVLRLTASDGSESGRLLVADSSMIVGACLEGPANSANSDYDAARRLLTITDGNFAYLNGGPKRPPDFAGGLCLSIERVLATWPKLPDSAADLFDQSTLLDKVFGSSDGTPSMPQGGSVAMQPRQFPEEPAATSSGPPSSSHQAWKFMQPLLSGKPDLTVQLGDDSDFEDISDSRSSLSRLRGQNLVEGSRPWHAQLIHDALAPTKALFWLILVFAISAGLTFLVNAALRQNIFTKFHNSLTIQKSALPE